MVNWNLLLEGGRGRVCEWDEIEREYAAFFSRCGLQILCAVNDDDDKLRILSSFALRYVEEMWRGVAEAETW